MGWIMGGRLDFGFAIWVLAIIFKKKKRSQHEPIRKYIYFYTIENIETQPKRINPMNSIHFDNFTTKFKNNNG